MCPWDLYNQITMYISADFKPCSTHTVWIYSAIVTDRPTNGRPIITQHRKERGAFTTHLCHFNGEDKKHNARLLYSKANTGWIIKYAFKTGFSLIQNDVRSLPHAHPHTNKFSLISAHFTTYSLKSHFMIQSKIVCFVFFVSVFCFTSNDR